jgi:hypothetical protein
MQASINHIHLTGIVFRANSNRENYQQYLLYYNRPISPITVPYIFLSMVSSEYKRDGFLNGFFLISTIIEEY